MIQNKGKNNNNKIEKDDNLILLINILLVWRTNDRITDMKNKYYVTVVISAFPFFLEFSFIHMRQPKYENENIQLIEYKQYRLV